MGLPLIDRSRLGQPQLGTRWDRASLGSFVRSSEQKRRGPGTRVAGRQLTLLSPGLGSAQPLRSTVGIVWTQVSMAAPWSRAGLGPQKPVLMPSLAQTR